MPGLESSNNNKVVEDLFYDEMMFSLLKIVLNTILVTGQDVKNQFLDTGFWEYVILKDINAMDGDYNNGSVAVNTTSNNINPTSTTGSNIYPTTSNNINPTTTTTTTTTKDDDQSWRNIFKWRLFTRQNKEKIQLSYLNKKTV